MRARALAAGACLLGLAAPATASRPRALRTPSPAPAVRAVDALDGHAYALVELDRSRGRPAVAALRSVGASLVSSELSIWRLRSSIAERILPGLERAHRIRSVVPDRVLEPFDAGAASSTRATAWWLSALGVNGMPATGPGKPVTVVDTGLDFSHPEFAGRPNTVALNRQRITSPDDFHGTAISSLIGARGQVVRGIYPRARLLEWDASERGGLTLSSIIAGIEASTRAGPGVINLSLGSDADVPMLNDAILEAFRRGSLVVAAGGDSRGFDFSPYPASYPHVFTVAATDRRNRAAAFSSASSAIDIAAPGQDITVAVPLSHDPSGYIVASGTSYAAALVSGAIARVWTERPALDNTQLIALLRRSATRLGSVGFSNDTGYGLLDLRAALSAPAPPPDPLEPNDDIDLVRPDGVFRDPSPLLTTPRRRRALLHARLDGNKDPADVYRAWIPAHEGLAVTARATSGDISLRVWGAHTPTIVERGGAERRDLLAIGQRDGTKSVLVENRGAGGELVYVAVSSNVSRTASYSLSLAVRRP